MSSYVELIDCPKCGNTHAFIDVDYRDKTKITGCDECQYRRIEKLINY
jgi:predicted RNA-binding Zn-ribbon protein involved in translation (DUF1610 family)